MRHCEALTDLGFTRDRQINVSRSGKPDLRARRSNLEQVVARPGIASRSRSSGSGGETRGRAIEEDLGHQAVAFFSAISFSSVRTVEASAIPSTRAVRKWRWNAVTTSRVALSKTPLGEMP
jgi:hypothetical protein